MKKNSKLICIFTFTFLVVFCLVQGYTNYRISIVEKELDIVQTENIEEGEKKEEQNVEKKEQKVLENSQLNIDYDSIEDYLQLVFPTDGNYYVEATGKVKFYSDIACTKEISNPKFVSKKYDYIPYFNLGNGYQINVCVYLMDNGNVCYCPDSMKPKLIKESGLVNFVLGEKNRQ